MSGTLPPLIQNGCEPSLRAVLGALLRRSTHCDFAVHHVRLAAIDFAPDELARVHVRLLLGRFDAGLLADLRRDDATQARLQVLTAFLASGRLDVRAAGVMRWSPDFSVHHAAEADVALVGMHQLGSDPADDTPRLTCVLPLAAAPGLPQRFERLWRRAHDVRDVIRAELQQRRAAG